MEYIRPHIRITGDGSPTLVCPRSGDTYHSVNGAVSESEHVFIRNGLALCGKDVISIFEAGFGSGINAWLTAKYAAENGKMVRYFAVEKFPVDPSLLQVPQFPSDRIFRSIHSTEWGRETEVTEGFKLVKIHGDLAETVFDVKFDVVYFDMFAPDTVPGLWTGELFARIAQAMVPGTALVTYCAKGEVKRALRSVGLEVKRLPGAPGKRHMVRAVKPPDNGQ
ncbi:MAG: tRNA (5-methylaminomethyl-2-thiouridine)(34)-methyltransferase MnmD [Alistipes sp.]|nr:tRNA (5-methylaminomethyl-2-thiouridine)(34)-methyltransferase MnmD [Alistipes sp.]